MQIPEPEDHEVQEGDMQDFGSELCVVSANIPLSLANVIAMEEKIMRAERMNSPTSTTTCATTQWLWPNLGTKGQT